jgi:hypothetical protein
MQPRANLNRKRNWIIALLIASLAFSACQSVDAPVTIAPTASPFFLPSATPTLTSTPIPSPTLIPDTGWEPLRSGLERRVLNIYDKTGRRVEYLYMIRLDPRDFQLGISYHPEPQSLEAWRAETGALIVVNGGYFRKEANGFLPDGLIVVNGKAMGTSYGDFAGMLAIATSGPQIRWLAQHPYDPREPLLGALQSFPLLIKPGGKIGFPIQNEDNKQARRTVIGQDASGCILLILAPEGWFTLHQLSAFLASSDLHLDIALNLDGGPSTGLILADPPEGIAPGTPLPIVITVHALPR